MEEQLMHLATEHGLWAVISIALLLYILKKQEIRDSMQAEREKKYQELLSEMTKKFDIVTTIQEDVTTIKEKLEKINFKK